MALLDFLKKIGLGKKTQDSAPETETPKQPDLSDPADEWEEIVDEPAHTGDYFTLACKSIGHSHIEKGTVCQDSTSMIEGDGFRIITVSDGHGSANFTRSHLGSAFACKAAEEALTQFAAEINPAELAGERRRYEAVLLLCKNILLRWHQAVENDHAASPFTEEEVEKVSDKYKTAYLNGSRMEHAYGATLIAVLMTKDYMLAIRNGDGECVTIDKKGKFATPIPWNEKCEANGVTSLCDKDAIMDFRFFYTTELPAAVFIGSDGVDNSYPNPEDLFGLYSEICTEAVANGIETAKTDIEAFLPVMTERGSQDDVSIAAILDRTLLPQVNDRLLAFRDHCKRRREAEDTRRKQARLSRVIKDKVKALETAEKRAEENKSELQKLTLRSFDIPGLELSPEESEGLRQGVRDFQDKAKALAEEISQLQQEKDAVTARLNELLASLEADAAAERAEAEAEAAQQQAAAAEEAVLVENPQPWSEAEC